MVSTGKSLLTRQRISSLLIFAVLLCSVCYFNVGLLRSFSPAKSVKAQTAPAPAINRIDPNQVPVGQPFDVTLSGNNFSADTVAYIGDARVDGVVQNNNSMLLHLPPLNFPGNLTLSLRSSAGLTQYPISVVAKPLADLSNGEITTLTGGFHFVGDSSNAIDANLNIALGLAKNAAGDIFVADYGNQRVRRIDASTGQITTVAGNGMLGDSGDNGPALTARMLPEDLTVDAAGNIYISDHNRIRRVDHATGDITAFAGNGSDQFSGDGGAAINAGMAPRQMAFDQAGNLYFIDVTSYHLRKIDAATGIVTSVAGDGNLNLEGFAFDRSGNAIVTDAINNKIYRVDLASGQTTLIAGTGDHGLMGDGGPAINAVLASPEQVVVDDANNIYFVDNNNFRVRKIDATGIISTVAGNHEVEITDVMLFGVGDGQLATNVDIVPPSALLIDVNGNLLFSYYNRIRSVDARTGILQTVAGGKGSFRGDGGPAASADLYNPKCVAVDNAGNIFFSDTYNNRVRRIDAVTGVITTVAGSENAGFSGDGGPATEASLDQPGSLTFDGAGNLYINDEFNARIRKVDVTSGIITTVAGNGVLALVAGHDGGPATSASINTSLGGIVADKDGNLYLTDHNCVRRVDAATGIIRTVVGGSCDPDVNDCPLGDGGPARQASVTTVTNLALDSAGNLYLSDLVDYRVRKVDAKTGIITTVAGNGRFDGSHDGQPANKSSVYPLGIALDSADNLYIADFTTANIPQPMIRRVDSSTGIITTVAGDGAIGVDGDGLPALSASLAFSFGQIAIDKNGSLYIPHPFYNSIRVVKDVASASISHPGQVMISNAKFVKQTLTINGSNFSTSGATVKMNGADISSLIAKQTDSVINLKGSKKRLNLKKGNNQLTVTVNGNVSNTYILTL